MSTVFKKIIDRQIPAQIVYEDPWCLAFRDLNAQAPTHVLLIPKTEIPSSDAIAPHDASTLAHLWCVVPQLAAQLGLTGGYRVVMNCGPDGGQTVNHLHFHILGGRPMTWPPG